MTRKKQLMAWKAVGFALCVKEGKGRWHRLFVA